MYVSEVKAIYGFLICKCVYDCALSFWSKNGTGTISNWYSTKGCCVYGCINTRNWTIRTISESVKKKCSNYGVQVYFRGGTPIKYLLVAPKDKDPMLKKSGVIYSYKCGRVECDEEYIRESSRTFGEQFKEHQKVPSPIFGHFNTTGHSISIDNFNIVGREDQNLKRAIKEALYIRVNNPSLNRYIGK